MEAGFVRITSLVAPCKDCTDRTMLCHSTCERYKEYSEANERERMERYEERKKEEGLRNLRSPQWTNGWSRSSRRKGPKL